MKCQYCTKEFTGRSDKIFCDPYCKSAFHYQKRINNKTSTFFKHVELKLKINRKILKFFNKGGTVTVRKELLTNKGFDPHYFTHYWKNKKGETYLFCFEHGFMKKIKNGKTKYILILWQEYMKASEGIT